MDVVEFLKAWKRMCMYEIYCENCKANDYCHFINEMDEPEKLLSVVEEWAKEHPVRTRQSEFLKMFPNAILDVQGILRVCPNNLDVKFENCSGTVDCSDCRRDYWQTEVE